MATYIPNATQTTEPTEDRTVESAALEFRTLKGSVNARIDAMQVELDATQEQIAEEQLQALRVPESAVLAVPPVASRAGKVLGFGADGQPIAVAVSGADDPSLRADLAQPTGDTLVGSDDGASGSLWTTVAGFITHTQEKFVTVKDYGAAGDGVADDTAAIQAMLTDLGYFTLIDGMFKITDTLYVPTAKNLGAIISGNGMEKSTINCVGMVGKPAITGAAAGFYRVSIRDLGIIGDADNAIGFTAAHAFYNASFDNLVLRSGGGSCFLMPEHFSCSWRNVHVQSIGGHGFDIEGGNSTVLINCYAHNFTVGNGKAGYRIRGNAVLIACNGVDSGDVWGIFGDSTEIGGSNSTFQIRMIGCNIEDFQSYALGVMFTGNLQLIGNTFIAKPSGTFETLIKGSSPVAANWRLFDRGNIYASKGATRSGQSNVITGTPAHLDVGSGIFTDYYNSTVSLLYPLANPLTSGPAYQTLAHKFPNLDADRFFGFVAQSHGSWTANASTFSVAGLNLVRTANTIATNLDNATGATINGHRLTILINDANTTIRHSIGGAGRFVNSSGANIVATNGKVYEYVHHNAIWWQVGG